MSRRATPGVLRSLRSPGSLSLAGSTEVSRSFAGTGVFMLIFMRSVTVGGSPSGYGSGALLFIMMVLPSGTLLKSTITS